MYRSVLGVLAGVLLCGPVLAAEVEEAAKVMDEVVVTATRLVEELSRVPANVTVITQAEIEQSSARNVPELLRSVPGVLVNDIAGNGRSYTVDLRGFGETASLNTLVLVDGRRVNQADLSGVDWLLVPKDRVQRIEIVRSGRGSVLYGDNATGGVINIITKKGAEGLSGTLATHAGSYETFQGSASVSAGTDKLSLAVNGNYLTSEGYRDNGDTLARDAGLNLSFDVSDALTLRLNAGYHEDETGQPAALYRSQLDSGVSRRSTNAPDDQVDTQDRYLQGGFQYFLTDSVSFDVDATTRRREADFSYVSIGSAGETEIDTLSLSPKLVAHDSLFGFDTTLLLGADYQKDEEDVYTDNYMGENTRALSKKSFGYYAHADVAATEQLSLSGGYRHERAKFRFDWIDGGESSSKTLDEDLFTVGTTYRFCDAATVYVSYAKSYRSPVLDEFYNLFYDTFNAGLNAQVSKDLEAGLRLRPFRDTTLGVNLFRVVTEREVFLNPLTYANENLDGDTVRQGVELTFSTVLHEVLVSGGYTYRDTEIDGGSYDGMEIPNVPRHQMNLAVQKTFLKRLQLGLNGTYVGERYQISDFDNSVSKLDDYIYVTGNLAYLLERGKLYLAVNNLLNEEYSEYVVDYGYGYEGWYPSPGINFVVGAELRF